MKRKLIFVVIVIIIIAWLFSIYYVMNNGAQGKWQVSELTTDGGYFPNLQGTIKNTSNVDCEDVQINFIAKSGDLKVDGWVWVNNPQKGESHYFDALIYGDAGDIENLDKYEIKLKKVECR